MTTPADPPRPRSAGAIALGLSLVLIGGLWLGSALFDVDMWEYGWPLLVVIPGMVILVTGFAAGGAGGTATMVPGAIVTAVGVLLAYQNATGHWESWAYAWALVTPGAVGFALWLSGVRNRHPGLRAGGRTTMATGAVIFLIGLVTFEGVFGISDRDLGVVGDYAIPGILIAGGLYLLVRRR